MKKTKILMISLLIAVINTTMIGFIPNNNSVTSIPNSLFGLPFLWSPPDGEKPVDLTEPDDSDLSTLAQYSPPVYTGTGQSYSSVVEQFSEIVRYGTNELWTGSNINLDADNAALPSQTASNLYATITTLKEHHYEALYADFAGATFPDDGYTPYEVTSGGDGSYTDVTHETGYARIGYLGEKTATSDVPSNDPYMSVGAGWTAAYESWDWQGAGYGAPDSRSKGYGVGYYRFYVYERGTTDDDHDTWCNHAYTHHAHDSAANWYIDTSPVFYLDQDFTAIDTGYDLTQAQIHITYRIQPVSYAWDSGNNRYALYTAYKKGGSWSGWHQVAYRSGSGTSGGWKTDSWDITSVVDNTDQSTPWQLRFRFTCYAYSAGDWWPQDIECRVDSCYLDVDYDEATQFNQNTRAGIHSPQYIYDKDTISANVTYRYLASTNWVSLQAHSRASLRFWISHSAIGDSGPGTARYFPVIPLNTLTLNGVWHTRLLNLTSDLGMSGIINDFELEFEIIWDNVGTGWGPMTNNWLTFDLDNIRFNFDANIKPQEIPGGAGCYLIDNDDSSEYTIIGGFGTGLIDWSKSWSSGSNPSFTLKLNDSWILGTVQPYVSQATVEIGFSDFNMAQTVNLAAATSSYSITTNATDVYWHLQYTTCSKVDDTRTDGSEVVTVSGVPTNYVADSVSPDGSVIPSAPPGSLEVSGSTSSTTYTLTARAPNYLLNELNANNTRCMENSSGIFNDTSVVYPLNWTSVRMNADAPGYVNLTIVNASRTLADGPTWDFGVEYNELLQTSPQVNSTPWQIPIDSVPGVWTIILIWNNSLNSASLNQSGMVSIPLDVRRATTTSIVTFGQVFSGLAGDGSDPVNPANVTLDGDPLFINVTWLDLHWVDAVTYCQKANITIDADFGPGYNDKPPYTTKELKMSREGSTFYYKIDSLDYNTWCYTGSHNFIIEFFSESTDIDGKLDTKQINGSFFVMVDILLDVQFPHPLPIIDEYDQGDPLTLLVYVYDISHGYEPIDNNSNDSEYYGLLTVNWSLILGNETDNIKTRWAKNETSGLLSQKVPGTFDSIFNIDSACEATDEASSNWWEQYYYLNFSVTIARNDSLDWEFEQVYLMNESANVTERMVGTPYEKLKWVKFSVEESEYKFITGSEVSWANDPIKKTGIDVFWKDWNNDNITIYVRYFGLEDNITRQFSGLNSRIGFVNSTYYNDTITLREGNVSYLRVNETRENYGDVYIRSEAEGTAWNKDWIEAIPYRWAGDTGGHYSLVPEINKTSGYYTGNLIPWDINNNLTWGWYYQNFSVHKAMAREYTMYITCQKLDKVWYNETLAYRSNIPYKFGKVLATLDITVNDNPVVLIQRDNQLIHNTPDPKYYWNDTLTLNLTAWDALNNGTVTPDHPDGVWKVEGFNLQFDLINMSNPLIPINESINIPEINEEYVVPFSTYHLPAKQTAPGVEYKFKITGDLQNYTIDDDGSPPIIPQKEITFFLNSRPTSLEGVNIGGVMEETEDLDDVLKIYENVTLDASGYKASPYLIPKDRIFTMSFRYTDSCLRNGGVINDANTWINITEGTIDALPGIYWEDNLADNNDGIYNFTIDTTGLKLNTEYRVTLSAKKGVTHESNYRQYKISPAERFFNIKILPIPVVMEEVINPVVTQGELIYIILKVTDPTATGNSPKNLRGAHIEYEIKGPGINPLIPVLGFMIDMGNGLYITALDTWDSLFEAKLPGMYVFEARLKGFSSSFDPNDDYGDYNDYDSASMLASNQRPLIINVVSAGPFGPLTSSMMLGIIGAVVVAGLYSTYHTVKILRVPYPLRMIEDTGKKIKRRRKTHGGIMKSREQQIVEEAETKLAVLGVKLEPISPKKLPPPITKIVKKKELEKELPALTEEQIKAELEKIPDLTSEEKKLFLKEIKDLSPSDQREFIAGLKGETKE